jgi:hypothetical protein
VRKVDAMTTTSPTYWILSNSLDAGGSQEKLPVCCGEFDFEGRVIGAYPQRVGVGQAIRGVVYFAGKQYTPRNLQNKWHRDGVYFWRLDEIVERTEEENCG